MSTVDPPTHERMRELSRFLLGGLVELDQFLAYVGASERREVELTGILKLFSLEPDDPNPVGSVAMVVQKLAKDVSEAAATVAR